MVNCLRCGNPIIGRPKAKFCSVKCRAEAHGEIKRSSRTLLNCRQCNKPMTVSPSRVLRGQGKFCSRNCFLLASAAVKYKCLQCGKEIGRGKKHCSHTCAVRSRPPVAIDLRVCQACGKTFKRKAGCFGVVCSKKCWGQIIVRRGAIKTSGVGGKRDDLGGLYVRSRWEANYARYLNWLKEKGQIKDWEYEPETFEFKGIKRGARFYTPDFRIDWASGKTEYHEIKGYMDARSQTRLKRMAKYHPLIKLLLIQKKEMLEIYKAVGTMIPGWEQSKKRARGL